MLNVQFYALKLRFPRNSWARRWFVLVPGSGGAESILEYWDQAASDPDASPSADDLAASARQKAPPPPPRKKLGIIPLKASSRTSAWLGACLAIRHTHPHPYLLPP